MALKGNRISMTFSLKPETFDALDAYAQREMISRSAALNRFCELGLKQDEMTRQLQNDPSFMSEFMKRLAENPGLK